MKRRWILALGLQILEMLAACALQALSYGVHPALYGALLWAGVPLAGLTSLVGAAAGEVIIQRNARKKR